MRKLLAFVAVGSVISAGFYAAQTSAIAAVTPSGTVELDCDNQTDFNTTLDAINWPGTENVFTAVIDDTIDIKNTGSTNACTFSVGTALDAGTTSIAVGATETETVANSGSFSVTPNGGSATTFYIDACSLLGSGFAEDPWLVGSADDFKNVGAESSTAGATSCSLAGSYLQTANLTRVDTDADSGWIVVGTFSGTYDGDHYSISYASGSTFEDREPLFQELSGTVEKLRLTGTIRSDTTRVSSLVEYLVGGTISEVRSSVQMQVQDSDAIIGGLVSVAGDNLGSDDMYAGNNPSVNNESSFVQYSTYSGVMEWFDDEGGTEGPAMGGLAGAARGSGVLEIRDSYSRATIRFDSSQLLSTNDSTAVFAGGLVGTDGKTYLGDGGELADGDSRTSAAANVRLVRTYAAGSFTNTCSGTAAECNTDSPSHVFTGGLIGFSEDMDDTNDAQVAAFWLSTSATNAVGSIADSGSQPNAYSRNPPSTTEGLPRAPGLSAALLKTRTTYQSGEEGSTNLPSGDADLSTADVDNDVVLQEQDYRWAIESGNVQTFVASDYGDVTRFLTRQHYADTSVSQTYRREGVGDLTAHGGDDPESVTGYPDLGRVWEICTYANDGYPVLVWEEEDCAVPGTGSTERSQAAEARSLGFTEEEYLRFLDSGLTWEQFTLQLQAEKSAALASTGVSAERMGLAAAGSLGLLLGGAVLLWANRRRSVGRSST